MPVPVRIVTSLGVPASDVWAGVCAVDAAVYGQEAWAVSQPQVEQLLVQRGYALSVAYAGSAIVGFSSAVCVSEQCARELLAAGYEERDLQPGDVLDCGPQPYWYGTSTCLLPGWTGRGLGTRLLAARLGLVASATQGLPLVTVVAQMWSDAGRATFARFGAVPAGLASMSLAASPAVLAARASSLL
jgi:GNAT superfamily N-acetyltransferase